MVPGDPPTVGGPPRPRGGDAADGALAGWLLVSALQAAGAVGDGGLVAAPAALATALVLAGAVVPFLRFQPLGWRLAVAGLAAHALQSALRADWSAGGRAAATLLPHLLALGYLAWTRAPPARRADAPAHVASAAAPEAAPAERAAHAEEPAAAPDAATDARAALAAIHRRVTAAGSACALVPADARAEAARHGVDAATLRREGVALYRTFLDHFGGAGPLAPQAERELACLAALLDLDPRDVAALRPAPATDAGVALAPGETCLAAAPVELYRIPAEAGAGADGLHLSGIAPARDLAGLARAGACRFVVTDRRLLLVAPSGEQSPLPLERIARAAGYANGIEIRPRRGPALFVRMDRGAAETSHALHRAAAPFHDDTGTP